MKTLWIVPILLLFLAQVAFAEECQYPEKYVVSTENKVVPVDKQGNPLKDLIPHLDGGYNRDLRISNPNSVGLNAKIHVIAHVGEAPNCRLSNMDLEMEKDIFVPPHGEFNLPIWKSDQVHCGDVKWTEPITFRYERTIVEQVPHYGTRCTKKDDGESCNAPQECGGGHCVSQVCTNSEICFNNDCRCSSDKVQCPDNHTCTSRGSIPVGVKPKCGLWEECETEYINETTGLCAKSVVLLLEEGKTPEELGITKEEQDVVLWAILGVGALVTILFSILKIIRAQAELSNSKAREIENQIEAETIKIRNLKTQIGLLEKTINSDEKPGLKTKFGRNLESETADRTRKTKELIDVIRQQESAVKAFAEPFIDRRIARENLVRNPKKDFYVYFYRPELKFEEYPNWAKVHWHMYKKFYNKKPSEGEEIHHIDNDKYNNEIWNLILLTEKDHKRVHRISIKYGDWEEGIKRLEQVGLDRNQFPRHVLSRMNEKRL